MVNNGTYFDLVGLVFYRDDITDVYRLDNVYGYRFADGTFSGVVRYRGLEYRAVLSFRKMQDAIDDTYAPATLKKWERDQAGTTMLYYQFAQGATPESVGLGPHWRLRTEL